VGVLRPIQYIWMDSVGRMHNFLIKEGRQYIYIVILRHFRLIVISLEKQELLNITCVCILTSFLSRIILSSVACLALPYFCTLPLKRQDFRKRFTEHERCILNIPTIFVWNVPHSKKNSARYHEFTYICV
jgi:hypothetical protein